MGTMKDVEKQVRRIVLFAVTLVSALGTHVEGFTFHWEIDETPQGSESVTLVKPVRVLLSDQILEIAPHSASLQLMQKYGVHLDGEWSSGHAYRLLRTFESIPQEANNPEDPRVPPSIWRLTHEHVQDDISIEEEDGERIVTISQEAFVHSEPLLAEIEGVRGRFFSKRLHEAVVRFVTDGGADRNALKRILGERYGVSLDVPDYTELTRTTTGETASRFSEFKNEELMMLASMFEEYPEGMRLTPGLQYLVRRLDGTPHPLYALAPAVGWPTAGYIEFMESAFQSQGPAYIHRLILHEKAHFLWVHLFDEQLRQDWIDLGGWYENPDDAEGWSTTNQLEFVSAYAHQKNPNEDMAESISHYIVTPDKLRSRAPAKYEFIQNRIMHGIRYISKIREDLTFQVYNLYPDLVYPGRIIRVDISVEGEPEEDKRITIEMELHRQGDQASSQASWIRIFSPKGTFLDVWLTPRDSDNRRVESGHILQGKATISKYGAIGYWAPDQISLRDPQGNERHQSQTDFGWRLYIDNPLADDEAPRYVPNSTRLSLSEAMESGRAYQVITATWEYLEENGMKVAWAIINDDNPETYSRKVEHERQYPGPNGVSVEVAIPDYFPSGTYWLNSIRMQDVALNWSKVYFTAPKHGLLRPEDVVIDEAPQTIEVTTSNPDITPPELDVNRITIQAEPTRPEDPNGETRVDIAFQVRDNISGYTRSSLMLRDPQGVEHHFWHHRDFYRVYFRGDPTIWGTNSKTITLPVGSIPGIWGLAQMTVEDKAQNILRADFTELLRFEVMDPDSQVAVYAIPQALLKISGDEQTGPAGEALSPFVVSVLDQKRGAYPGAPVAFEVVDGDGGLTVEATVTDSSGQAATTLTLGTKPGINTVEAIVAGLLPVTFTAHGLAIPQDLTIVSGEEQQGTVGTALSNPFVVVLLDHNGDPLPEIPVEFAVTEGQGALSVQSTTTDAGGQASAVLTLGPSPGSNAVEATVAGLDPVTFTAIGLAVPQTLTKLSGDQQQAKAGAQLAEPLVVSVRDQDGVAFPGARVTFAVLGDGGTLSVETVNTDAEGRAATTLTLGRQPGTYTVEATVAELDPVTFTATAKATPDFDGDGVTGFSDFFLFAEAFGGSDPRFDLDGSGSVDFADFFLFAEHFGQPARAKLLAMARERIGLPEGAQLRPNAPNPFNSQTVISWFQLQPEEARLEVFTLTGQRVAVLHEGAKKIGLHRLHWDGRDGQGRLLASGVYVYRLVTAEAVQTRKLTLLR